MVSLSRLIQSNHIDSFRALENPKFILLAEGNFFRKSEQEDVRSDPIIAMVSTPNADKR